MTDFTRKSNLMRSGGPERRLVHSTTGRRADSADPRGPRRSPPVAERSSKPEMQRSPAVQTPRPRKALRRLGLIVGVGGVVIVLLW